LPRVIPNDVRGGDRIAGAPFAGRSAVWGVRGAAASAHPMATLAAIDILRAGGSAVDAAIAANACLGFLEPTACGIGGDVFAMLWDPAAGQVVGLNGSGRSPRGLSLDVHRERAVDGRIWRSGAVSVSVPGAVDGWAMLHRHYGRLPWKALFEPAIALCEAGAPVPQTIAALWAANLEALAEPSARVEESDNCRRLFAPDGSPPAEGQVFRNPDLARTYRRIAEDGPTAFYEGEIALTIEGYFRRIGGFITRQDLAAHAGEWTTPLQSSYRGVEVYGLGPNTQGLATLQMLNILESFDLGAMGLLSAASVHHQAEAKRLAFEDRARFYADPAFAEVPVEWLVSKAYAAERAAQIRPDRLIEDIRPGQAPSRGDTTYLCAADADGMMVSLIQSNFRGMGSGLVGDGLGFMFQNRGELFALEDGHPNVYAPGKRPFHTIIPGFAVKDGAPWLAFGVMGGDMQPQGQAQVIVNMVDHGLQVQEAGDAPRWRHEGSSEPTGRAAQGAGVLHLESGAPERTRAGLAAIGWRLGPSDGGFGGYQAIQRAGGAYAAASEMRKDGLALAI
jgi:gamma-glutamyltranspeptidase/glutathione hydrolase